MLIKHEFEVRAGAKYLFDLTQDYTLRSAWDTLTSEAYLINATQAAVGAQARCIGVNGLSMDIEYVSYKPNEVAAVKMVDGPYIFDQFAGGWHFKALSDEITRVRFSYNITAKPRWLSWVLTPILCLKFKRETEKRIVALTAYSERHFVAVPVAVS